MIKNTTTLRPITSAHLNIRRIMLCHFCQPSQNESSPLPRGVSFDRDPSSCYILDARWCLAPEVNRLVGRLQQRRLAAACRHPFHGLDLAIPHQ